MRRYTISILFFLLIFSVAFVDAPASHPDGHAPIGVMGAHGHKAGEMMLSYRFMAMDMRGLQSGTDAVETADVLKDFTRVPTTMDVQMHMFGAMFAPHDKITLMAMTNYQQRYMEMEGAHHHTIRHQNHPVGRHEMFSAGIGDVKLDVLLTLWERHHLTLLCNVGVSFPTGSIAQVAEDGRILSYPMQLGSGSFEARPGITFFGMHGNWSYGGQLRGVFPLQTNASEYRHGNTLTTTAWSARRVNDWFSLGGRLLLSRSDTIAGSHPDLDANMSPSHRSDFRGGSRLDIGVSGNLMVPTGTLAGQQVSIELTLPIYQHLTGMQLKQIWQVTIGWQYAFRVL